MLSGRGLSGALPVVRISAPACLGCAGVLGRVHGTNPGKVREACRTLVSGNLRCADYGEFRWLNPGVSAVRCRGVIEFAGSAGFGDGSRWYIRCCCVPRSGRLGDAPRSDQVRERTGGEGGDPGAEDHQETMGDEQQSGSSGGSTRSPRRSAGAAARRFRRRTPLRYARPG